MISTERFFHMLLAATFITATLAANVDQWLPPGEHARLVSTLLDREPLLLPAIPNWAVFTIGGAIILSAIATFIGLISFKRWSRTAAIPVTLVALAIKAVGGTGVTSGPSSFFLGITAICWGAAIAMTYCPPLSIRFKKTRRDS